ncbi:MAG: M48 family metallopeptidase [Acidobacteria bacterium]|nr:M48 family metallopeptidase [Acidobacteriota bacterium]
MATDFFERQDIARRNTTRLVILFVLAVLAIIASIDLLLAATMGYLAREPATGGIDWALAADPQLLAFAVAGTLLVVSGGSLFKVAQLRGGGRVVAEQLGGRRLNPDTPVPSERQLLNVVEEMAIASGTPVPPVYLLDQEEGINAFAAGFAPGDAVIGVTRGAAERLTRDELQGVMAHEFSHVLNGDMRLNIRLIGLLHGILIIGILGYFILRMTAFSGYRRRSRQEGNQLPILALGVGLMAVGFFGTFFGNLIKAAVSRQREFLADASAVQFTRQPEGLAGALRKIGGLAAGSAIQNPNAPEASHLFFGRATSGLSGLFSTHPPLSTRIRRIDPSWDGSFPEAAPVMGGIVTQRSALEGVAGLADAGAPAVGVGPVVARAVDHLGQPSEAHLRYAARLVGGLPSSIVSAAHEPHGARAVVYALLLDRKAGPRRTQLAQLSEAADPGVYRETLRLAPAIEQLDVRARLPLLDIALPALRGLTAAQYERFRQNVNQLVQADDAIDPFEWSLHRILLHELETDRSKVAPPRVRHHTLAALQPQCEQLLSALARAGQRDAAAAERAFEQAWRSLNLPRGRLRAAEGGGLGALDAALAALDEAAPRVKRQILRAAVVCITADDTVTATEAELLRALSASLGCPMPPLLIA